MGTLVGEDNKEEIRKIYKANIRKGIIFGLFFFATTMFLMYQTVVAKVNIMMSNDIYYKIIYIIFAILFSISAMIDIHYISGVARFSFRLKCIDEEDQYGDWKD